MEYKKISDTQMEVTETVTRKAVLSLDGLLAEKDGLLRTIKANNQECTRRNEQINQMIANIDSIIAEAQNQGLKKESEVVDPTPVEEVVEPVVEPAVDTVPETVEPVAEVVAEPAVEEVVEETK